MQSPGATVKHDNKVLEAPSADFHVKIQEVQYNGDIEKIGSGSSPVLPLQVDGTVDTPNIVTGKFSQPDHMGGNTEITDACSTVSNVNKPLTLKDIDVDKITDFIPCQTAGDVQDMMNT